MRLPLLSRLRATAAVLLTLTLAATLTVGCAKKKPPAGADAGPVVTGTDFGVRVEVKVYMISPQNNPRSEVRHSLTISPLDAKKTYRNFKVELTADAAMDRWAEPSGGGPVPALWPGARLKAELFPASGHTSESIGMAGLVPTVGVMEPKTAEGFWNDVKTPVRIEITWDGGHETIIVQPKDIKYTTIEAK